MQGFRRVHGHPVLEHAVVHDQNVLRCLLRITLWSVLTVVTAILLVASIIGTNFALSASQTINIALKTTTHKVVNGDGNAVSVKFT